MEAQARLAMPAKGYHHGDLRTALIDKAMASLGKKGELPGWRALARACGVSQSAPYRHFASVDDLRNAVVAEGFRRLEQSIMRAVATKTAPLERLAAGCGQYMRFGIENPALYGLMFADDAGARSPDAEQAAAAAYKTLIEAVAATGVKDVLGVAFAVWTSNHGLVDIVRAGVRAPGTPKGTDALIARGLDMTIGYVRSVLALASSR